MKNEYRYTVAGHSFAVAFPYGLEPSPNYGPFCDGLFSGSGGSSSGNSGDGPDGVSCGSENGLLFRLEVVLADSLDDVPHGNVKELLNDEAPYFWIFEDFPEGQLSFGFSCSKSRPDCILRHSGDYSAATVYVGGSDAGELVRFAVDNSLMLLYTFCTSPYDTLMVHASVAGSSSGGGYMFLGRSGTGKSTHSRLWLKNIAGTFLLNDDNPVVRVEEGNVYVYGSPWSGKTPCYRNMVLPLKAVVRLSQAPHNRIERLSLVNAYAALFPSCSCMRWDSVAMSNLHSTLEKVVSSVPSWHLECLPDDDAAMVCRNAVMQDSRT
ncbi:MAG: hypothetical protein NC308_04480 [Clostridium sp.]|nr:hypothetical protein [Bacteroides sp.]MCM1198123.1 hypothetical protein [Clostridium sp.]